MRGRKPKSTAQKRLEGNPGKRALNASEPVPPPADAAFELVPTELETYPAAVEEWTRLAPMLRRCKQITHADRAALMALCLEWARYLEFVLFNKGTITGAFRSLSICMRLWVELGLTPSARSRIKVPDGSGPGPERDGFSEFDETPTLPEGSRPN